MRRLSSAILILMLLFALSEVKSQQLQYDIIWLGKVGNLSINKTQNNEYSFIETNSEVRLPFYKLNWVTTTKVQNGQLLSSNYAQLLNNKKREYTDIEHLKDSSWQVINDVGKKEFIQIKNSFNVSDLYFREPINEKYIFSERFGVPIELVQTGDSEYRLLLPDGNHCDFFYKEGVCTNVKAKNGSRTIKFVLREDS